MRATLNISCNRVLLYALDYVVTLDYTSEAMIIAHLRSFWDLENPDSKLSFLQPSGLGCNVRVLNLF